MTAKFAARAELALPVALQHPVRLLVYVSLMQQAMTARDVADACGRPLGTVAYHLRVLVDVGLVGKLPEEGVALKDL